MRVLILLSAALFGQQELLTSDQGIALEFSFQFTARLEEGRCDLCKRLGLRSTVTMDDWASCTAMLCGSGYYDESGVYHVAKPCNTCSMHGRCSRGHVVYQEYKSS